MKRILALLPLLLLTACVARESRPPVAPELREAQIGLVDGYRAWVVAEGLMNPSHISFHPDGRLTVCDTGNGRIVTVQDGKLTPVVEGLKTEFWKVYKDDAGNEVKAFKVGPLTAQWIGTSRLAFSDGGQKDGQESILTVRVNGEQPEIVARTNTVPPTTDHPDDLGEGNLSGMTLMPDGDTYYVGGQGYDGKTWVLGGRLSEGSLEPLMSADDNGISVNSPMQVVPRGDNLLVIYSGAGGEDDGLIVEWNPRTRKPVNQWALPGLNDPMSLAQIPGSGNRFVVTANNWSLTEVRHGKLAIVTLHEEGADIKVIADRVFGPVHCAFGPDGRLYVSCLGTRFDSDQGHVLAITGFGT
jgi:hypothetical protein